MQLLPLPPANTRPSTPPPLPFVAPSWTRLQPSPGHTYCSTFNGPSYASTAPLSLTVGRHAPQPPLNQPFFLDSHAFLAPAQHSFKDQGASAVAVACLSSFSQDPAQIEDAGNETDSSICTSCSEASEEFTSFHPSPSTPPSAPTVKQPKSTAVAAVRAPRRTSSQDQASTAATAPRWTSAQDRALLASFSRHGKQWHQVFLDVKKVGGPFRSLQAVRQRGVRLQDKAARQQQQVTPVISRPVQAKGVRWTREEDEKLVAACRDQRHKDIFKAFCLATPGTTRSAASVLHRVARIREKALSSDGGDEEEDERGEERSSASAVAASLGGEAPIFETAASRVASPIAPLRSTSAPSASIGGTLKAQAAGQGRRQVKPPQKDPRILSLASPRPF